MAALNAPPEAGDAPNSCKMHKAEEYLRSKRNCRKSLRCYPANGDSNDSNPLLSTSNTSSNSILKEAPCNDAALIKRGDLREAESSAQLRVDKCGFPYYRSASCSQDAVLVKDAAVLCTLLNDKVSMRADIRTSRDTNEESDINSKSTTAESLLIKQLKIEYNDLSSITRKISAYTKDILSSLLSREWKRSRASRKSMHDKQAVGSHRTDEMGNPNMRLRLQDDVEIQYSPQRNVSSVGNPSDGIRSQRRNTADEIRGKERRVKRSCTRNNVHEMNLRNDCRLRKLFPVGSAKAKIDSTTCSSSSVYNFLMAGERQSTKELSTSTFRKLHKTEPRRRAQKKSKPGRQCQINSEMYEPVPFTNWKEISSAVIDKCGVLPLEDPSAESRRKVTRNGNRGSSAFKRRHNGRDSMPDNNNFLQDTNFHTINIRIVTQNSQH